MSSEFEVKERQAIATFLGVKESQIHCVELSRGAINPRFIVVVEILYRRSHEFVKDFTPPFEPGNKVIPVTAPIRPRGGTRKDELTDKRKRTVTKVSFDRNTRTWWIWLKGKKFPFNPNVFRLVPPRA